jgi:ketosteroid isomerase-like protein
MASEDVELVLAIYDAFNRRDLDALLRSHSPDAVYEEDAEVRPDATRYRGIEQLRGYFENLWATTTIGGAITVDRVTEVGDLVLVNFHAAIVGEASGAAAEMELVDAWHLRRGRIIWLGIYRDETKAVSAAMARS